MINLMPERKYRRTTGALLKVTGGGTLAVLGLALWGAGAGAAAQVLGLLALVGLVAGLVELPGYVAFEGQTLRDDSIPPGRVEQSHATAVRYQPVCFAGNRFARICVFVVVDDQGKSVVIPRYGYPRQDRADLFVRFKAWCAAGGLSSDRRTTDALEAASRA
jgi:hypothetical protein